MRHVGKQTRVRGNEAARQGSDLEERGDGVVGGRGRRVVGRGRT